MLACVYESLIHKIMSLFCAKPGKDKDYNARPDLVLYDLIFCY